MALTNAEILELENLLKIDEAEKRKKTLLIYDKYTSPNYKFLKEALGSQVWQKDKEGKKTLKKGFSGVALEGSSRSTKTWGGIYFIIYLCLYKEKNCTINIYRETYNEFKTTLYEDFRRILDIFNLPNKFKEVDEVKTFKIGENRIYFLGDGKHGGACDYSFFNEIMFISQDVFRQAVMRTRKFWWADYNPSFTSHWFFDHVLTRDDVGFLRTTYKDNPFIAGNERLSIEITEPYLPGSYEVKDNKIYYRGEPISEKNQPPMHPINVPNGTADLDYFKIYGLGLRGAIKGTIFNNVVWIDKFPDIGYIYGNDFGFTTDPNSTVKYAETETSIFIEPLVYQPIETPEILAATFEKLEIERHLPIIADSSDKYTGENKGTVEMVYSLKMMGYSIFKVSKKKSILFWLNSMKSKKIHIVKNHLYHHIKKEQENYRMREINGIAINEPIDKFNHFWDAARYCHMEFQKEELIVEWN